MPSARVKWSVRGVALVAWLVLLADAAVVDVMNAPMGQVVQLAAAMATILCIVCAVIRPMAEIAQTFYDAGRRDERKRWLTSQTGEPVAKVTDLDRIRAEREAR